MIAAVLLSLVSLLPGQFADTIIPDPDDPVWVFVPLPTGGEDDLEWDFIDRDCEDDPECISRRNALADAFGADTIGPDENTGGNGGRPGRRPTVCEPRAPRRPEPDVEAMPRRIGEIVHEAGDGDVVTGMETEFRWEGPDEISWTQPAVAGVTADCTRVPGEPARFTASVQSMVFDFEIGDPDPQEYHVDPDNPVVTHVYGEEGKWTVCVYIVFEIPDEGFAALTQVAELDHDVVAAPATLVR
jgi:hypothetical protein